ncbi:MAG: hypothetical protein H6Q95_117 [Nitrospirae bacterium]|nr:hypothetical protein [Nitrospirota bacterium]
MRIPEVRISLLSKEILEELLKKGLVELKEPKEKVTKALGDLMLNELMVEERLNAEVREILKQYDSEIEKGRLDYRRLFEMTKKRLVMERNIVL